MKHPFLAGLGLHGNLSGGHGSQARGTWQLSPWDMAADPWDMAPRVHGSWESSKPCFTLGPTVGVYRHGPCHLEGTWIENITVKVGFLPF